MLTKCSNTCSCSLTLGLLIWYHKHQTRFRWVGNSRSLTYKLTDKPVVIIISKRCLRHSIMIPLLLFEDMFMTYLKTCLQHDKRFVFTMWKDMCDTKLERMCDTLFEDIFTPFLNNFVTVCLYVSNLFNACSHRG